MSFRTAFLDACRATTAIDRLREQRKPTVVKTPPKPKPVTDEQLLAVVEQLAESFDQLREYVIGVERQAHSNNDKLWRFKKSGPIARLFGKKWWTE